MPYRPTGPGRGDRAGHHRGRPSAARRPSRRAPPPRRATGRRSRASRPATGGRPSSTPLARCSAEQWEPQLAQLLALLRRRLTGDYEVDEFGFDAEVTEKFTLALLRPIAEKWFRVEVRGIENIPAEGGALIVSNHSGTVPVDALMTMVAVHDHTGRFLRALGADLVFRMPFVGEMARRGGATLACNEDAERMLSSGELVGVWPEGFKGIGKPFSQRYKLQRFGRGGFVSAALRTGVPIVPLSVVGAEEIYPLVGNVPSLARLLGVPYVPITPFFPLARPARPGPPALEVAARVRRADPHRRARRRPAADDPMLVFNVTDQVRETIQQTLYDLLMKRESVFVSPSAALRSVSVAPKVAPSRLARCARRSSCRSDRRRRASGQQVVQRVGDGRRQRGADATEQLGDVDRRQRDRQVGPPVRSSSSWVTSMVGSATGRVGTPVGGHWSATPTWVRRSAAASVGQSARRPGRLWVHRRGAALGLGSVTLPGGSSPASDGSTSVGSTTSGRLTAGTVPVPNPVPTVGSVGASSSRSAPAHVGHGSRASSSIRTSVVTACTHSSWALGGSWPSRSASDSMEEAVKLAQLGDGLVVALLGVRARAGGRRPRSPAR